MIDPQKLNKAIPIWGALLVLLLGGLGGILLPDLPSHNWQARLAKGLLLLAMLTALFFLARLAITLVKQVPQTPHPRSPDREELGRK